MAGDIVFNGIHPWRASSTPASRIAWLGSLDRSPLQPRTVVAGHKARGDLPNTPDVLTFMRNDLTTFDRARERAANVDSLAAAVRQAYPELAIPYILGRSARAAFSR